MKKKIIVALLLLGFPFTANADMISDEEEALRIKFEEQLRRCSHLDKSRQRSECNVKVRNKWDTARNLLKENPDLYFENKYGRSSSSAKWHGPAGYIRLKNDNLHTPDGRIYYKSSSQGTWHGPDGFIKLDENNNLHTPGGIYFKSK